MTIEQKIGQMLVFGWAGASKEEETTVNDHAREIVRDAQVGGVVLLGRNIADDLAVTAATLGELQSLSREPLLIAADQEGGMVARFVDGVTVFPSNMALGATRDPSLAYKAAAATADELAAIGVNHNYAPCVDVNNNPDNPIIGTRSYGESPELCAEFAAQAVRGYQDRGVIACAKHFPGHGDTAIDSHLALPSVPYPRERLDEVELVPFRAAIAAGISSIMTTHIMFPALDPERPSTLSPAIITGLLRNELGFDGVVVTDCMEMKAIADVWGTPEAAVMAIEAGVDLVLVCHTRSTQQAAREAILKAVNDGRIPESRLDESVRRISALKKRYRLAERRASDPQRLNTVLRGREHLAVQREIAERSMTIVRNDADVIPIGPGARVMVTGLHWSVGPLAEAVDKHVGTVESLKLENEAGDAGVSAACKAATHNDVVIVPVCPHEPWRARVDQELQARLVNALQDSGAKLVVVAVREPYVLRQFPQVPTQVCTYGYREGVLEAAARALCGEIEAVGRLPVSIPGESQVKTGEASSGEIQEYF